MGAARITGMREEASEGCEERTAIRGVRAALPPMGLLTVCFFLPFVRVCGEIPSAAKVIAGDSPNPLMALWIAPRFVVGALLAIVIGVALVRGRAPGRAAFVASFLGVLAALGGAVTDSVMQLGEVTRLDRVELTWALCAPLLIVLGGALLVVAWRRAGWTRWARLVGAYAAVAATLSGFIVSAVHSSSETNVGVGGWIYVGAIACLAVVCTATLARRRS